MELTFSDLKRGDQVYSSDGRPVGSVTYSQSDGAVWLALGDRGAIRLDARNASRPGVRLGAALVFANKHRRPNHRSQKR
jgi:hypothetical protein